MAPEEIREMPKSGGAPNGKMKKADDGLDLK
jgi:hypothetical protein